MIRLLRLRNAFRLSKLVGFEPTPPIAARAMFSATLGNLLDVDLVMPTPVIVDTTANDVPTTFELFPADENNLPLLEEDIVIPAGSFSNTAIVGVEGQTLIEQFLGTGAPNQSLSLGSAPVIFDSVRVDIDGIRWEKVDFFTDSQPRQEFRVEFNSDYEAFVIFGNAKAGAIPTNGSAILVTYRVGGGSFGNVTTNSLNVQQPFAVEGIDVTVPVELANYTRGEFGYDGDTVEDIRRKLPAYLRTQNRAVTGDDYKALADQFATQFNGQIGKSTAVLRNHGCAGNIIDLFILARDGDSGLKDSSNGLKTELTTELNDKKMITDYVCIKDGEVISVDISIDITADRFFRKFKDEVESRILSKVTSFFDLVNWEYGDDLRDSDIVKAAIRY